MHRSTRIIAWTTFFFANYLPPAHAYLDPGSIGLAFQLGLGALAAGFVAVKMYMQNISAFIQKLFRRHQNEVSTGEEKKD